MTVDFKQNLINRIAFIEKELDKYLRFENEYPEVIFKAMRYSIFAGGKRLRPIMLLAACEAFGGDCEKAVPFACAIEMIHTYSLIHDDLPALDNDDYRRGNLTSHKVFGEDIAILTGDALLNHAFETMTEACCKYSDMNCIKAMNAIGHSAGTKGMIGGQVVDVMSEGKQIDKKTLEFIHKNKTAAMIQGALTAGAYIGGASEEQIKRLNEVGEKIGIAFQIQDDILDVTSTVEVLGKPILSDEKNQKVTYVTMYGLEESKEFVKKISDEAIITLNSFDNQSRFLIELTEYLIKRDY